MASAKPSVPRPVPDPFWRFVWVTLTAVALLGAAASAAAMFFRKPAPSEDWASVLLLANIVGALTWAALFAARAWCLQSGHRAARWVRMGTTAALLWALPGAAGGVAFLGPSAETFATAIAFALWTPLLHPFGWPAVLAAAALTAAMERRRRHGTARE